MKKRNITLAAILLVFVAAIGTYTYARYVSSLSGNATATVAKWAVSMKKGEDVLTNGFTLPFVVESNEFVVENRIAPDTTATAVVDIDLTGTEVAVDYEALVDQTALETFFGDSAENVTVTTTGKFVGSDVNDDNNIAELINGSAFTAENGKLQLTITLNWANSEDFNISDTLVGTKEDAQRAISLPVTVKLQQHIALTD